MRIELPLLKKKLTTTRVGDRNIVIMKDEAKTYLPPVKCSAKKTEPKTDFALLGKAIVGNLGFSELETELCNIKKCKPKFIPE